MNQNLYLKSKSIDGKSSREISMFKNLITLLIILTSFSVFAQYPAGSPVAVNGRLKVQGVDLVNECGYPVQLRGMSTHGPQWYGNCINNSSLTAMKNSWGADIIRLAMYVESGGYKNNPTYWKSWIDQKVDEIGALGMYCLIDWHILSDGNPLTNLSSAQEFWTYMSNKHKGKKHVLYEICNEPNGSGGTWANIKTYSNDIIPKIRANDPDAVIIVGTPTWSQDVDIAANDKLNYPNIMYTLHFYSGSHFQSLRDKANLARTRGAAVFVTEFGTSLASGDGGPYLTEGDNWMNWMATNKISWCNWSFADKAEVSAALNPNSCSSSSWTNTSTSGTWVRNKMNTPDNFTPCNQGPVCDAPDLGPDRSICGVSSIILDSKIPTGAGITYTWKRNGTNVVTNSTTAKTYTATQAGTYVVEVNNNSCIKSDEIIVSATLSAPDLGGAKVICNPASYNLSPSNLAAFPAGTTWQWSRNGTALTGETNSTLSNVRTAGTYRLTATVTGCSSTFSDVAITSNLPVPVDGCRSNTGTVGLSVTGGTGPFSWFSAPTGGTSLATGTSFTTPSISTTTTYYVQEGGASTTVTVGPATNSIGGVWEHNNFAEYKLRFNALQNLTINSIRVYPVATQNVTIRVLNSSGTVVATKIFNNVAGGGAQTLDLGFNIPQGDGYFMDAVGTTGHLLMNHQGQAFPYTATGVISIYDTAPEWARTNGWYFFFYNWSVSTGSGCARMPVIATISASCTACTVPAQPSTITGSTSVCAGTSGTYSVTAVTGVTYNWTYSGTGVTFSGNTASVTATYASNATSGTITVTPSNACGNGTARTLAVTVNPVPAQPSTITGSTSVCAGTSGTYSVTAVTGVTYNWTYSGTGVTFSGNTASVTATYASNATSGTITVTPSNACGNGTARTQAITVNPVPAQPSTITGNATVCAGTSGTYSVTNVTGVTYNWTYSGTGVTFSGNTASVTATFASNATSGTITVTPSNACGNGVARTQAITVNPVPAQPSTIAGTTTVCAGTSGTYSVTNVTGVTYNWTYSGTGVTFSGNTASVTATFASNATSGTITVTPSNACGNGAARTQAITVNPVPAQPSTITGNATVCAGTSGTYSVTNVTGVTYNWTYSGTGVTFSGNTASVTATFAANATSGTITVTPSNACGNGTARTQAITVNPVPAQPSTIAGNATVCAGTSGTYSVTNVTGVTYNWTYSGTGVTFS
ncbi:MAG: cellulase family glycosylhydrolase, partial [Cytophagaceae bacterium]